MDQRDIEQLLAAGLVVTLIEGTDFILFGRANPQRGDNYSTLMLEASDLLPSLLSSEIVDALKGAQNPSSSNFFITRNEVQNPGNISVIHTKITTTTIQNTATETSILNSTVTIAAGTWLPGRVLRLKYLGFHSASGNPTIRVRIKLGSTTVLDTGAVNSNNSTNAYCELNAVVSCRSVGVNGVFSGQGFYSEQGGGSGAFPMQQLSTFTLDTTVDQIFQITVQWGTASNNNKSVWTDGYSELLN